MNANDERTWCTDPAYSTWRDVNNSYCIGMYISWAVQFCGWVLLVLIGMTVRQKVIQRYQIQEPSTDISQAVADQHYGP